MAEVVVDEEQKRKILKWLGIGVASVVVIVGGFLGVSAFIDSQNVEAPPEIATQDLAAAQLRAEEFITAAGTFGISDSAVSTDSFSYVLGLLTTNQGFYENEDFGVSRSEAYDSSIIPLVDPTGEIDDSSYFSSELNGYTPDWSGQIAKYSVSNILVTPGESYEEKGSTLLPLQVSFTSTLDLYKNSSSFATGEGPWNHYQGEYFETVDLVLSQQAGDWTVWSISDLEDYPFLLNTWSDPNWRDFAPNVNILEKLS